jgi:hypothetical protein
VRFLGLDGPFEEFSAFRGPATTCLRITGGKPTSLKHRKPSVLDLTVGAVKAFRRTSPRSSAPRLSAACTS